MLTQWGISKTHMSIRALQFSFVDKMYIFQGMGKIFCVEFQKYPFNILPIHWKIKLLYNDVNLANYKQHKSIWNIRLMALWSRIPQGDRFAWTVNEIYQNIVAFFVQCILPSWFLAPVFFIKATLQLLGIGMSFVVVITMIYSIPTDLHAFLLWPFLWLKDSYVTSICLQSRQLTCIMVNSTHLLAHHGQTMRCVMVYRSLYQHLLNTHLPYKVIESMVFREHHLQRNVRFALLSFCLVPSIYVVR